jgi:predicted O-methyltransferase YrrM
VENVKRLLAEVPHWCPLEKAQRIYDLVLERKPALCVEIGVFGGGSFFAFAFALKKLGKGMLVGIDPWTCESAMQGIGDDDAKKIDFEEVHTNFMKVREREKLTGFTHVLRERAESADWYFEDNYSTDNVLIDILHVDGNHSFDSVVKDLTLYLPRMKEKGIIIIDDINWPTVAAALEQFPTLKQLENHTTWGVYENRINHA